MARREIDFIGAFLAFLAAHPSACDPQGKVKANRMPYDGMSDTKDVDDVVAYLKTLK
jgi:cytochrome c2